MTKKYKEGQILRLRDGRLVYLHHDEGGETDYTNQSRLGQDILRLCSMCQQHQ